jgi:hypothetical protein
VRIEGKFRLQRDALLNPDEGAVNPGLVASGVYDVDPVFLNLKDFHGKKLVYRSPAYFGEFGAGSFSEIGFIIFDDRTFIFLGGEGCVDPVSVSIQIFYLFPVILAS